MSERLTDVLRSRLGLVITSVVLTAAITGAGTAVALTLPKNSVKSSTIKNGAIKRVDMAPGVAGQFARVAYAAGVPSITAQSGGISIVSEPWAGAVRIAFPMSMDSCAITATAYTGGATTSVRRSSTGGGMEVVVVGFDDTGSTVETNFDMIGQC